MWFCSRETKIPAQEGGESVLVGWTWDRVSLRWSWPRGGLCCPDGRDWSSVSAHGCLRPLFRPSALCRPLWRLRGQPGRSDWHALEEKHSQHCSVVGLMWEEWLKVWTTKRCRYLEFLTAVTTPASHTEKRSVCFSSIAHNGGTPIISLSCCFKHEELNYCLVLNGCLCFTSPCFCRFSYFLVVGNLPLYLVLGKGKTHWSLSWLHAVPRAIQP